MELIFEAITKLEGLEDEGLSRIDYLATELPYQVDRIGKLRIDAYLTPSNS